MYLHPAFAIGVEEALPILEERAFGLFVVPTADGAPEAVHVPFLTERDGEALQVTLHVARANPIHRLVGEGCNALLACQGPDAYISPDWYGFADQVPTWTYTAVHLKGRARVLAESDHLDHVDRLSAHFEQRLAPKPPWTSGKMTPQRLRAMLKAVVAIALNVTTVEAQKKLIQHKPAAARAGAVAGLRERGDAASLAIAALLAETL